MFSERKKKKKERKKKLKIYLHLFKVLVYLFNMSGISKKVDKGWQKKARLDLCLAKTQNKDEVASEKDEFEKDEFEKDEFEKDALLFLL